jgi:hypothetical protein
MAVEAIMCCVYVNEQGNIIKNNVILISRGNPEPKASRCASDFINQIHVLETFYDVKNY